MTNSFLPPLDPQNPQPASPAQAPQETVLSQLVQGWEEQETSAFMRSFQGVIDTDPDTAAEIKQISAATGQPPNAIASDINWARRLMAQRDMRLWLAVKANPVIREQFANPEFAQIAWDDLKSVSAWQDISGNWRAGQLVVERGKIGTRMMSGIATGDDHKRLEDIDRMLQEELPSGDSWIGGPARMFGLMSQTLPKAIALGSGTAATAAALGNLGPQAAVPEEVIIVPAAFVFGMSSGMAIQAFQIEGGNAYIEYKRAGFDEGRARVAARSVGTVNAVLEVAGLSILAAPAKKLVQDQVKRRLGERLARMTPFEASTRALKGIGAGVAGETGPEVLQELSTMIGEEVARVGTETMVSRLQGGFRGEFDAPGGGRIEIDGRGQISVTPDVFKRVLGLDTGGADVDAVVLEGETRRKFIEQYDKALPLISAITEGEVGDRLIDTAIQTVKGVWLPGAIGPSIQLIGDSHRITSAQRMDKVFEAATQNVAEAKAAARDADVFSQFIAGTLDDSVADTVYVSKDRVREKMEKAGVTEEQLERDAPEIHRQLREPNELNDDIEVPMGDWLGLKMNQSDIGLALREDLRIAGKDSMSLAEAEQAAKTIDEDVKALRAKLDEDEAAASVFRAEAEQIEKRIRTEITAAGVNISAEQARISAQMHRRILETLSLRAGVSPAQFEEQFGQMQIVRGQGVDAATFAQTDAFKAWFGDSKVTEMVSGSSSRDAVFAPQVVYHATTASFEEFEAGRETVNSTFFGDVKTERHAVFFTPTPERAAEYVTFDGETDPGARTIPAYLSVQNPLDFTEQVSDDVLGQFEAEGINPRWLTKFEWGHLDGDDGRELVAVARKLGYDGIVFLEEGPDSGKDFETWAVFDPAQIKSVLNREPTSDPNILKQDGDGEQTPRGTFNPRDFVTKLFDKADASTFFHEAAHYYLEALLNLARNGKAPTDVLADLDALAKWGEMEGWEDLATASIEDRRKLHEKFAYRWERYLHEGKPASADRTLLGMFRQVRAWLTQVYKDITRTPEAGFAAEFPGEQLPELSDEVRAVMDRLVESQEAIDYAHKVRSVEGLFELGEDSAVLQVMPSDERDRLKKILFDADFEADEKLGAVMMRQLRYMKNFRGKFLKEVQSQTRAARKRIREEVYEEQRNEPVHRAQRFFNTGEFLNALGEVEPIGDMPKRIHEADGAGLPDKWTSPRGASADVFATAFGYQSGQDLVDDLLGALTLDEVVDQITDERLAVEHDDLLNTEIVEERLIEAMSGPAFQKLIAEQLRFYDKGLPNGRVQRAAARAVARRVIGGRVVGDLRPMHYSLAASRAQRAASKARRDGDIPAYRAALRSALFQNAMAEAASEARDEIRKGERNVNKRYLKTEKKLAEAGRIPVYVTAGRLILSRYGLVTPPPESIDSPTYDPFAPLEDDDPTRVELQQMVDAETTDAKNYRELTVDELRDMFELSNSLWFRSKREKQVLIDGERAELEDVLAQMVAKLGEHTVKERKVAGALTKGEKRGRWVRKQLAQFKRMEFALQALDRGTPGGIFTKAIWRRAKDAANQMRLVEARQLKKLQALVDQLDLSGGTITAKSLEVNVDGVPTRDFVFGRGEVSGKAEIIMALLHSGNESNMFKLVAGHKWGRFDKATGKVDVSRWLDFINQKVDDGTITKKDMDVVQAIWDLNEEMKPAAQRAHYEVAGYRFREIQASPLALVFPGEGLVVYKGGYVPAATDRDQVVDAQLNELDDMLNFQKKLPMVPRGFMKNRASLYARELDLNPMRLAEHVHSVQLFSHIAPAMKDIRRITESQAFKTAIDKVDPQFRAEVLVPWLEALASQRTTKAGKDTWGWLNRLRARAGQAVMFFNVKNSLQNYTGIPVALTVVDGRNLRMGLGEVLRDREGALQRVADQSDYMRDRLSNTADIYEVRDRFQGLVIDRGNFGNVQAWFQKNAYWLQRLTQEPIDAAVWIASYNKAIEDQGPIDGSKAHTEAVQRADAAVRQTQTSNNPEDLSSAERGSAWAKLFLQFRGWFISYGNLIRTQMGVRAQRDDRMASLAALYMIGIFAPLVAAEAIDALVDGDEIDKDEDGAVWDDVAWRAMQSHLQAITGAVPIWGDIGQVAFNTLFEPQSWSARMPEPAAIGAMRQGLVYLRKGDLESGRGLRSVFSMVGIMIGIPIERIIGPAFSGYELMTDQADFEGQFGPGVEVPRALITGRTQRPR